MMPPENVAGFEGHEVYMGGGGWRYDHPDGTAVWVYPDPESGNTVRTGPRRRPSRGEVREAAIQLLEGRSPTREQRRRRETRERLTRWDATAQLDYPDGKFVPIVDGAPRDEAFRRAAEWMRSRSGGRDDPFGFGGVDLR